jgi:hypothetical protein
MAPSHARRIGISLGYRGAATGDRLAYSMKTLWCALRLSWRSRDAGPPTSLVISGRNDDYMPDFYGRLEATISWNQRFLSDEVVFVEWNPPSDRPLLSPSLAARFPALRAIVVPPEVHRSVCRSSDFPLLEFHAKNVGIRRARLPWILASNADGAAGLDSILALRTISPDPRCVWTAQRVDINWRGSSIGLRDILRRRRVSPYSRFGTGEFVLAHSSVWAKVRGYDERMNAHRFGCDSRGTAQMELSGARLCRAGLAYHLAHPSSCTEGVQAHHGLKATLEDLPYSNPEAWGLADLCETEIAERVWRLE